MKTQPLFASLQTKREIHGPNDNRAQLRKATAGPSALRTFGIHHGSAGPNAEECPETRSAQNMSSIEETLKQHWPHGPAPSTKRKTTFQRRQNSRQHHTNSRLCSMDRSSWSGNVANATCANATHQITDISKAREKTLKGGS